MRVEAQEVYFDPNDENGAATVAFQAGAGDYVLLQRTLDPDSQDLELGLAGVYLEVNDQGAGSYDGIRAANLTPLRLVLELNGNGASIIGAGELIIEHHLPPERVLQLSKVLAVIFDGYRHFTGLN